MIVRYFGTRGDSSNIDPLTGLMEDELLEIYNNKKK